MAEETAKSEFCTLILLYFQDGISTGNRETWHSMHEAFRKEPKWRWIDRGTVLDNPRRVVLVVGWEDGNPLNDFMMESIYTPFLSSITPLLVDEPRLINVGFSSSPIDYPYRIATVQAPHSLDPASVVELMIFQVPGELRSACEELDASIQQTIMKDDWIAEPDQSGQRIVLDCYRGWADRNQVTGSREWVMLWKWRSLEDATKFKTLKDTEGSQFLSGWYAKTIQPKVDDLQEKGVKFESVFLQIKIAACRNGWSMIYQNKSKYGVRSHDHI